MFPSTIRVPSPDPTVAMKRPRLLTSTRKQASLPFRQGRSGRRGQQTAGKTKRPVKKAILKTNSRGPQQPDRCFARSAKPLRALTLKGPELAAAILGKQKRVENRSWPINRTGEWMALHVGKGRSTPPWIRKYVIRAWDKEKAISGPRPWQRWNPEDRRAKQLPPRAAIVGLIRFGGMHRLARGEKKTDPWALGPLCWELDRVVPVNPPICDVDGALGLWRVDRMVGPCQLRRLKEVLKITKASKGMGRYL